jgi:hypothetical protein
LPHYLSACLRRTLSETNPTISTVLDGLKDFHLFASFVLRPSLTLVVYSEPADPTGALGHQIFNTCSPHYDGEGCGRSTASILRCVSIYLWIFEPRMADDKRLFLTLDQRHDLLLRIRVGFDISLCRTKIGVSGKQLNIPD